MFWRSLLFALGFALFARLPAAEPTPTLAWDYATVGPLKTSIYVGRVTLLPEPLLRQGNTLTARYEVEVAPWFFWGETGQLALTLPEAELAKLTRGETAEFSGSATNHKNKLRQITGRAQPEDATTGKIKVRITADGFTLIFNSTYRLHPGTPPVTPSSET